MENMTALAREYEKLLPEYKAMEKRIAYIKACFEEYANGRKQFPIENGVVNIEEKESIRFDQKAFFVDFPNAKKDYPMTVISKSYKVVNIPA